jgi:hypothetical protein
MIINDETMVDGSFDNKPYKYKISDLKIFTKSNSIDYEEKENNIIEIRDNMNNIYELHCKKCNKNEFIIHYYFSWD